MKLRSAVNKLLNITYLMQRIDFLEKAVTVLLDRHHLKGLYLSHNPSIEETDEAYQNHRYKDIIYRFLYKKTKHRMKKEKDIETKEGHKLGQTDGANSKQSKESSSRKGSLQLFEGINSNPNLGSKREFNCESNAKRDLDK